MPKPKSEDYRAGYYRAKSDILQMLKEANSCCDIGIRFANDGSTEDPTAARKKLHAQLDALRWVRALVKALKLKGNE